MVQWVRLRIRCYYCSGLSCCCGMYSTLTQELPHAMGTVKNKKKKKDLSLFTNKETIKSSWSSFSMCKSEKSNSLYYETNVKPGQYPWE